jgi:hypothetical protein
MGANCCSRSRCRRISCEICARRYARRITRRILTATTAKHYVITIDLPSFSLADFWAWRVEVRNFVDYRRRVCRYWRGFALHVWFSPGGLIRGITSLDSVTCCEVTEAFGARWPTTLRSIESAAVRQEITAVTRPCMVRLPSASARYQRLKLAIWPLRSGAPSVPRLDRKSVTPLIEPMPIII